MTQLEDFIRARKLYAYGEVRTYHLAWEIRNYTGSGTDDYALFQVITGIIVSVTLR